MLSCSHSLLPLKAFFFPLFFLSILLRRISPYWLPSPIEKCNTCLAEAFPKQDLCESVSVGALLVSRATQEVLGALLWPKLCFGVSTCPWKSSKVQGSIPDLISADNTAPLSQAKSLELEWARVILSRAHVSPCPMKYLQSEYKLCYNGKAPLTVWEWG